MLSKNDPEKTHSYFFLRTSSPSPIKKPAIVTANSPTKSPKNKKVRFAVPKGVLFRDDLEQGKFVTSNLEILSSYIEKLENSDIVDDESIVVLYGGAGPRYYKPHRDDSYPFAQPSQ